MTLKKKIVEYFERKKAKKIGILTPNQTREKEISQEAERYVSELNNRNPATEAYDFFNTFRYAAQWADSHPRGFLNDEGYLVRLRNRDGSITNKEFIKMLQEFPEDALVSIECCNPRAMVYDEKYNLIRID